jgi:simple sugar transport system ATP-binding protein
MTDPTSVSASPAPLASMRAISKSFPGVLANDRIDLDIHASEIHALLGENGAGKSTLMKILYGFYRADSGEISMHGRPVSIFSPHEARAMHIGMVFQDLALIPAFTVAENIALFLPHLPAVLDARAIESRINEMAARYDLQVRPRALVSQLSIGEQQKVEILKLLLSDARLLILDEPTRVLAPHEVQALFRVLASLRRDGFAIVLITHKMKEVLECADRISVLRGGRVAGTLTRAEASEARLLELMFDKKLPPLQTQGPTPAGTEARTLLELRDVGTQAVGAAPTLSGINLRLAPGEIVGVAGVSGNGQRELGDVVLGIERCAAGRKFLFGQEFTRRSIRAARTAGVAYIPESPLALAAVPWMTVLENMVLSRTQVFARWGGLRMDWRAARSEARLGLERFGYSVALDVPARSLSGGNLQRMVIVRELAPGPQLIVASYLTRGLDVHSALAARQALLAARAQGAGVLLISEDLEELFALSDRLVVMFAGRMVGEFRPADTTPYEVGRLMTGAEVAHDVHP